MCARHLTTTTYVVSCGVTTLARRLSRSSATYGVCRPGKSRKMCANTWEAKRHCAIERRLLWYVAPSRGKHDPRRCLDSAAALRRDALRLKSQTTRNSYERSRAQALSRTIVKDHDQSRKKFAPSPQSLVSSARLARSEHNHHMLGRRGPTRQEPTICGIIR